MDGDTVECAVHRSVDAGGRCAVETAGRGGSRSTTFVEIWSDVGHGIGSHRREGAVVPREEPELKYAMSVMADNAPANGFSENSVLLRVSNPDDAPLAGLPIAFSADNGATVLVRDLVTNHYGVVQV